jgi:ParB family transcriptional regulator, chromosome partitioning protein
MQPRQPRESRESARPAAARVATKTAKGRQQQIWDQLLPSSTAARVPGARLVPIDQIAPSPEQPRKGELEDIDALAESIAEHGQLQPVVLTPPVSDRHTLIFGHRRLAAFKLLAGTHPGDERWTRIWAVERDVHSDDRLVLALTENLARQSLTEPEIVTGFRVLHDMRGWNQSQIARRVGMSAVQVSRYFTVAADGELAEHVQTGGLSISKAYEVRLARTPEARSAALTVALHGGPLREIRRAAKDGPAGASGDARVSGAHGSGASGASRESGESDGSNGADRGQGRAPQEQAERGEAAQGEAQPDATAAGAAGGPAVATAALDASVRNLAELAGELGITFRLGELQLARLIKACLEKGTDEVNGADFIRLLRADLRDTEALVRAAARRRRAHESAG